MKKLLILPAILVSLACMDFMWAPTPHTVVYKLDKQSSTLGWMGKNLKGEHIGTIQFLGGELRDNHGNFTGKFDVDMKTIICTNLSENSKSKLEGHLKSEDFFGVDKFPTASLAITSMTPATANENGHTHTVTGNLTIRDKTNPVTFNAKLSDDGVKRYFSGTAIVNRTKFDVKYGSKVFFPHIGDKAIDDEFTLSFNVALIQGTH